MDEENEDDFNYYSKEHLLILHNTVIKSKSSSIIILLLVIKLKPKSATPTDEIHQYGCVIPSPFGIFTLTMLHIL